MAMFGWVATGSNAELKSVCRAGGVSLMTTDLMARRRKHSELDIALGVSQGVALSVLAAMLLAHVVACSSGYALVTDASNA